MEWISAKIKPANVGKYVVETKTTMGNIQRLECTWNGKTWSLSNQIVLQWLKE